MIDAGSSEGGLARIELALTPEFGLGGVLVRPARRQIRVADDDCRELEPRVMQVLVALAMARGAVVSRDRLIDTCWRGRIVGDDSLNRCVVALRRLAREIEPKPFTIETIKRVGYCLVENRPKAETANVSGEASRRTGRPTGRAPFLAATGLALLGAFAAGMLFRAEQSVPCVEDEPMASASSGAAPARKAGSGWSVGA
ncbi:MAG TPA: winged helix-turn-helix domain-containing protein [Allosphingosinicella sp.]|jgi:DNA-binding winged helix-turn-helix (wHTH) protein